MGFGTRIMRHGDAERDRERWISEGGWVHDLFGGLRYTRPGTAGRLVACVFYFRRSPGRGHDEG